MRRRRRPQASDLASRFRTPHPSAHTAPRACRAATGPSSPVHAMARPSNAAAPLPQADGGIFRHRALIAADVESVVTERNGRRRRVDGEFDASPSTRCSRRARQREPAGVEPSAASAGSRRASRARVKRGSRFDGIVGKRRLRAVERWRSVAPSARQAAGDNSSVTPLATRQVLAASWHKGRLTRCPRHPEQAPSRPDRRAYAR